ncbi:MAG: hypothetical protein M1826_002804 [Phylliscum demangeonii]|nr:MAG: hypothetical protein M1826_002804 [Phylliscum demangeonii]
MSALGDDRLPAEVILLIMGYLRSGDICALCRVTRRLRALGERMLYEELTLRWLPGAPSVAPAMKLETSVASTDMLQLLHTLLHRPDLCAGVRRVRFLGYVPERMRRLRDRARAAHLLEAARSLIARLWPPSNPSDPSDAPTEEFRLAMRGLEDCDTNLLQALILSRLANVESVETGLGPGSHAPFLGDVLLRAGAPEGSSAVPSGLPRAFHRLRRVSLVADRLYLVSRLPFRPVDQALPLFYLPAIADIDMVVRDDVEDDPFRWRPDRPPPLAATLTTLVLRRSLVAEDTLAHWLRATPNLHTFEYGYEGFNISFPHTGTYLDAPRLRAALEAVRHSLRRLVVSARWSVTHPSSNRLVAWTEDEMGIKGRLGSLADFGQLEHVETPFTLLVGCTPPAVSEEDERSERAPLVLADLLPPGLRRWCCSDDRAKYAVRSRWLAADLLPLFQPFLRPDTGWSHVVRKRRLELHATHPDFLWTDEVRQAVERMCRTAAVEYVYVDLRVSA